MRTIKFSVSDDEEIRGYSVEEFEKITGVKYLSHLEYRDKKIFNRSLCQCKKALEEKLFSEDVEDAGEVYSQCVRDGCVADVFIKWICSKIGHGLFADKNLKKGDYIGEYTGVVFPEVEADFENRYYFTYPTAEIKYFRKLLIDSCYKGNEIRYINHSDEPNAEVKNVIVDGMVHVILCALKPIPRGIQITYDYSEDYWKALGANPQLNR